MHLRRVTRAAHRAVPAAVIAGLGLSVGAFVFAYSATHPRRKPVHDELSEDSLLREDVVFPSRDGVRLSGWFVPAERAVGGVILCHGFPSNRAEMIPLVRLLRGIGMHVLLFDFRALGRSEGNLCTIGFHEVRDLLGATDYLTRRPEMAELKVGVFGNSMGGAVAIMAAAEDERIAAVATHGAYATLESAIAQRCRMALGPLGPAVHKQAVWWGRRLWLDRHPRDVSPVSAIGAISPRPVLLLHGAHDHTIRADDANALFEAAGGPKRLTLLPRSWHIWVHPQDRQIYEHEITQFFRDSVAASGHNEG
jgi:fermentation-respiration switch protein FrsA (DUF1100 family)